MEQKTIFLGSLKPVGKDGLKGRVYLTDDSIIEIDDKGRKYIPVVIWRKKELSEWGHTHSLQYDSWKPEQKETIVENKKSSKTDLPF